MSVLLYQEVVGEGLFQVWSGPPPGMDCAKLCQVHGTRLVAAESAEEQVEGDGLLSAHPPPRPLSVRTADCLPVLVLGEKGVALLHVGHRGLRQKIHLQDALEDLRPRAVLVGPHIRSCCFEVGEDFCKVFPDSRYFHRRAGKLTFDLAGELEEGMLRRFSGVKVWTGKLCTCCDGRFHSYRRNRTKRRNWNIYSCSSFAVVPN